MVSIHLYPCCLHTKMCELKCNPIVCVPLYTVVELQDFWYFVLVSYLLLDTLFIKRL